MDKGNKTYASIDIGTNSIHLVIAEITEGGEMHILDSDKANIRLGKAIDADGNLTEDGINRTVETLKQMADISRSYDATIRAVATHATREANNYSKLLLAARDKAGIKIEIIDGIEEARLVHLGIRHGLHLQNQSFLGVDIGGGSTEIIITKPKPNKFRFVASLKLGAVTLSERFFKENYKDKKIESMRDFVQLRLSPLSRDAAKNNFELAVATSGSAKAIAQYHAKLFDNKNLSDANGYTFNTTDLRRIYEVLLELKTPKKIHQETGMDLSRAEIILAGTTILMEIAQLFSVNDWVVSTYSLREGLVVDTHTREYGDKRFPDVQWHSVQRFAKRLKLNQAHAEHVSKLCLKIFDQLIALKLVPNHYDHEMVQNDRRLLEAASNLYEAGKFISAPQFHKHSLYLISNSRLFGFTQFERHIMGLIARYHRKGAPSQQNKDCSNLSSAEFRKLTLLSGILRLASALDRSRQHKIDDIELDVVEDSEEGSVLLTALTKPDVQPEAELHKTNLELLTFNKSVGINLELRIKNAP